MTRVLLAEDDVNLNSTFKTYLNSDIDIDVIDSLLDGDDVIKSYIKNMPDVLVLDLDLPHKNGLQIIDELSNMDEEKEKCNIIVISGNTNYRLNMLNTSKIHRVLPKPFDFTKLSESIHEIRVEKKIKKMNNKELNKILLRLNFDLYSKGTLYLIRAIKSVFPFYDERRNLTPKYLTSLIVEYVESV